MQLPKIPLTIAAVMGLVSLANAHGGHGTTITSSAGASTPTQVVDGTVMSILPLAQASPYMLKEMDDSYLNSADYKYAYESQYPCDCGYDKETDEYYDDYAVSSYASPTAQFYGGSDVPTATVTSTGATAAPTGYGNSFSNGTLSSGSYITNGTTSATNATVPLTNDWDNMHSGAGKNGATTAAAAVAAAAVLALGL